MLSANTRIYLEHPTQPGNLIPGVVIGSDEEKLKVQLFQPIWLNPGQAVSTFYHDQHNCFNSVGCKTVCMDSSGPNPVLSLHVRSGPERHEKRQAFRVLVSDDQFIVDAGPLGSGHVINVSCEGMGVLLDTNRAEVGEWITLEFEYDLHTITGRFQVRNHEARDDGRFRFGLHADPTDGQLHSELSRITQDLQQLKARRASRLASKPRPRDPMLAPGSGDDDAEPAGTSKPKPSAATAEAGKSTDGDDKRQHHRKPWSGPAKIYICEKQNLRVLDVCTIDLSPGGLCFSSKFYIYPETELLFEKPTPQGLFRIRARARNVFVDRSGLHRVGVQFIGAPLKPKDHAPELVMATCAMA